MHGHLRDFEEPLAALGQLLAERGEHYELLAIGGGALQLLGLITRPTRDIDVLALVERGRLMPVDTLPAPLQQAVDDTATVLHPAQDLVQRRTAFAHRPRPPDGVLERAHRRDWGGLSLHIADRRDQIFFKVYAAVDQGPRSKHFEDLQRLRPTDAELRAAAVWARSHDPSEGFARELRGALRSFGVTDDDE